MTPKYLGPSAFAKTLSKTIKDMGPNKFCRSFSSHLQDSLTLQES